MKTQIISVTLLLTFVVFGNAKPHRPPLPPHKQAAKEACLKKLGLTEQDHHDKVVSGELNKDDGCFKACMYKELGVINAEGDIDREAAIKDLPPHISRENQTSAIEECFEKKGDNDCETASLYHSCTKQKMPRPPMDPKIRMAHENCKQKLNSTDDDVRKMVESMGELRKECYLACVAKEIGIMNEKGALDKKVFIERLPPHVDREDAEKIADECEKEEGEDECETIVLLMKCFKKNNLHFGGLHGPRHGPPHHPRHKDE